MSELAGQHALVTGASRGIGEAIAERLVREGVRVTLLGRKRDTLTEVAARLGGSTQCVVADVSDAAAMQAAVAQAEEGFGPLDILVNNAGQARSAALHKADDALWQDMLAVNLSGTYYGIRAALPGMLARNAGRIINVASTAGLVGYPYVSAYCAAKHGVIGLTRALALEVASTGITVNAVCPGYTDTDLVSESLHTIQARTGRSPEQALAALVKNNPQRRLVKSEEVAAAVHWLCQPDSASITGQSIAVAGGEVM